MSLAQLEYFVAVAEEEHLTRAAARLHISQPPLTRHMKSLEQELGVPLFARTARGMKLLPAGEVLLQRARQILGLVASLPQELPHTALAGPPDSASGRTPGLDSGRPDR